MTLPWKFRPHFKFDPHSREFQRGRKGVNWAKNHNVLYFLMFIADEMVMKRYITIVDANKISGEMDINKLWVPSKRLGYIGIFKINLFDGFERKKMNLVKIHQPLGIFKEKVSTLTRTMGEKQKIGNINENNQVRVLKLHKYVRQVDTRRKTSKIYCFEVKS